LKWVKNRKREVVIEWTLPMYNPVVDELDIHVLSMNYLGLDVK